MAWKVSVSDRWRNGLVPADAGIWCSGRNPIYVFIIPWHWDLSGILGMMTLCVIVGSLIGSFIAVWLLVRAMAYIIGYPISYLVKRENDNRI